MLFNLEMWGEEVHLTHWDSLHGQDVYITLHELGVTADYYDDKDVRQEDIPITALAAFLRDLISKRAGGV